MPTFMDQLMSGEAVAEDFAEYVAAWHCHPSFDGEVYEYLGMSEQVYLRVAVDDRALEDVVAERRNRR